VHERTKTRLVGFEWEDEGRNGGIEEGDGKEGRGGILVTLRWKPSWKPVPLNGDFWSGE